MKQNLKGWNHFFLRSNILGSPSMLLNIIYQLKNRQKGSWLLKTEQKNRTVLQITFSPQALLEETRRNNFPLGYRAGSVTKSSGCSSLCHLTTVSTPSAGHPTLSSRLWGTRYTQGAQTSKQRKHPSIYIKQVIKKSLHDHISVPCNKSENNANERQVIFKWDLITHKALLPLLKDQN